MNKPQKKEIRNIWVVLITFVILTTIFIAILDYNINNLKEDLNKGKIMFYASYSDNENVSVDYSFVNGKTTFDSNLYQSDLFLSAMNRTFENATYITLNLETCKQIPSNYGQIKYRCEGIWN